MPRLLPSCLSCSADQPLFVIVPKSFYHSTWLEIGKGIRPGICKFRVREIHYDRDNYVQSRTIYIFKGYDIPSCLSRNSQGLTSPTRMSAPQKNPKRGRVRWFSSRMDRGAASWRDMFSCSVTNRWANMSMTAKRVVDFICIGFNM